MCKFHKDVARSIATNPKNNEFNRGAYAVALVAMAHFRTEQYMPSMYTCDGFVPAQMTSPEAITALEASGLTKPLAAIADYHDQHIDRIRAAMNLTARSFDLSLSALNITDIITADGYKSDANAKADITTNGPFLNEAVVQLFMGYKDDSKTWADGKLTLIDVAHKPQFEAIRQATEFFMALPDVAPTLKTMFEHSLVKIFVEARHNKQPALATKGCVMCGHGDRTPKAGK